MSLSRMGHTIITASSGEEAITYMQDGPADLMVLDMIMDPGMDGLETYQRVLEINPAQKAIIASGYSESKRVKEAQRLGAGQYVDNGVGAAGSTGRGEANLYNCASFLIMTSLACPLRRLTFQRVMA